MKQKLSSPLYEKQAHRNEWMIPSSSIKSSTLTSSHEKTAMQQKNTVDATIHRKGGQPNHKSNSVPAAIPFYLE